MAKNEPENISQKLVSIILPTYNGCGYLRSSVESCLNQTYKHLEIIVVDDGSSDGTAEIVMSFEDTRIKYLRHKKNLGLPKALNTGFVNATGGYLTWTSDDNQYMPDAIEAMVNCLAENGLADFVYADYWVRNFEAGARELRRLDDVLDLRKWNGVGPCFLYTRRVYEAIGGYNPVFRLVEDYDYWIRITEKFSTTHLALPLYVYTAHKSSLTVVRCDEVRLYLALLHYRHKFITLKEFEDGVRHFFYNEISAKIGLSDKITACAAYLKKIADISPALSLRVFFYLARYAFLRYVIRGKRS